MKKRACMRLSLLGALVAGWGLSSPQPVSPIEPSVSLPDASSAESRTEAVQQSLLAKDTGAGVRDSELIVSWEARIERLRRSGFRDSADLGLEAHALYAELERADRLAGDDRVRLAAQLDLAVAEQRASLDSEASRPGRGIAQTAQGRWVPVYSRRRAPGLE